MAGRKEIVDKGSFSIFAKTGRLQKSFTFQNCFE